MKIKPQYVVFNGEVIEYEKAQIHVMTPCVRYGALVFEGLKAYWNDDYNQLYLFRAFDHSKRLIESAKILRFDHNNSIEYLNATNIKLLKALGFREDLHLRQMLYVDGDGPLDSKGPTALVTVALPRGASEKTETGLHLAVSSWVRIDDRSMPPRIKAAANYQNGRLAKLQAKADGYDNALLLNMNGKVSEGPGACFFMVKNGRLITPLTTSGILESITRDTLIQIARNDLGYVVEEREIDRTELYLADEAFLCGSGAEITPVISIDRHILGNGNIGSITFELKNHYLNITCGKVSEYSNWLTPVY